MLKPILILCLGNEIISDDGFGVAVAQRLMDAGNLSESVEVVIAPLAGFALLDHLAGRKSVLIVDTIRTGYVAPGTLHKFTASVFTPSKHLTTSHQISLPTALELGRQLGMDMPEDVDIIAVEAVDLETLSEQLTPAVRAAVDKAVRYVKEWISQIATEEVTHAA